MLHLSIWQQKYQLICVIFLFSLQIAQKETEKHQVGCTLLFAHIFSENYLCGTDH